MKLALSSEQQRAVESRPPGEPVSLVDPASNREYVLVEREKYERVRLLLEEPPLRSPSGVRSSGVSPEMRRSQEAFWRELPRLLEEKRVRGWWVCYHGEECIGFARTGAALVQRCLEKGLQRGQFYVARIDENLDAPWESREIEKSLYELADGRPGAHLPT